MRKILGAWVFVVAAGLAIGALGALGNQIYMGGPSGAAWRTASGDWTINNAGVATINPGVVGNSKLANASTTVNGQICTLGSSCTVTAAATSLAVGSTTIMAGTNGHVEYNNSGVLGELATTGSGSVVLATSPSISGPTVTSSFTATGLVTNADLANSAVTVNGTTCTLGSSCTPIATAPLATASSTGNTFTAPSGYFVCTSTCTVTPPVPAAGYEFCVLNDDNVSTVITLGAIGSSARYENTARTAYGTAGTGTLTSGGAVGDMVCIVGRDSTHYLTTTFVGTWTAS